MNSGSVINEECTKLYLILPFLSYLGYDITSPQEIIYEYACDMHEKGNRRVDCAILDQDGSPLILVEAKAMKEDLSAHWGQIKSYLVSSSAKYAILTDGNTYSVFNRSQINGDFISAQPFYTFMISDLVPADFDIIRTLAKINAKLPITIVKEESNVPPEILQKVKIVEKYLSRSLPENWEHFDLPARRKWLKSNAVGTVSRKTVCNMEIWAEALLENPDNMDRRTMNELRDIMNLIPNWKRIKTGTQTVSFYGRQRYYERIK